MNWKNIIEFAGFLAIIVGLFLVLEELRLSRTIARAEMSAYTNGMLNALDEERRDPEFAATMIKSRNKPHELTPTEREQLNSYLLSVLKVYMRESYNYRRGIFEEWTSLITPTAPYYFGDGYGRAYWSVQKQYMQPHIVEAVDNALKNTELLEFWRQFDQKVVMELGQEP